VDKINWDWLSRNPNAILLLERNLDKINWNWLSRNPNAEPFLFNLDYEKMRECFQPFAKEIAEYVFHPTRLVRFANKVEIDVADYLEYF
jgi:hypothetical protein